MIPSSRCSPKSCNGFGFLLRAIIQKSHYWQEFNSSMREQVAVIADPYVKIVGCLAIHTTDLCDRPKI
jgi:hypothetical protein